MTNKWLPLNQIPEVPTDGTSIPVWFYTEEDTWEVSGCVELLYLRKVASKIGAPRDLTVWKRKMTALESAREFGARFWIQPIVAPSAPTQKD